MKRLIAFISILMFVSMASGTAVSITIYGTNKSNADSNVTCYGCNNTIEVQAWNTSYVKNISVQSVNASGDVVSFNISNITAFRVQELKVNGTAINAYQAGANGMLNFSYTVTGNKTFVLSPAVNVNGYNMTWLKVWSTNRTAITIVEDTVYQNTVGYDIMLFVSAINTAGGGTQADMTLDFGASNPPTEFKAANHVYEGVQYGSVVAYIKKNEYYKLSSGATLTDITAYRVSGLI